MTLEPENGLPAQPEFVQGSSGASSSSISPRAATQQLTPVLAIKSEVRSGSRWPLSAWVPRLLQACFVNIMSSHINFQWQGTQPSLSKNAMIAEPTPDPKGKQPEQAPSPRQSATAPEATSVPKETLQKVQKQLTTTTEVRPTAYCLTFVISAKSASRVAHRLSERTKHCSLHSSRLSPVKSASTSSTNLSRSPLAAMSHATPVFVPGSKLLQQIR